MAARKPILNLEQDTRTRAAIQTTQLIKRLQCYALDEKNGHGHDVELDANRLRAIEILLRKTLPDQSAVTLDATLGVTDGLMELMEHVGAHGSRIGSK